MGAIAENVKHTSLEELFASVEAEMLEAGLSDVSNGVGMSWSNFQPNDVAGLSFRRFYMKIEFDPKTYHFNRLCCFGF